MTSPVARRAAAVVFLLALGVMVGVPLARLAGPKPARFGWHMYSAGRPMPDVWVVYPDRTVHPVATEAVLGHHRSDFTDLERHLTPHLLRLYPGAVAVRYQRPGEPEPREYP
ncbi:MAG TPA: hypothetical protein VM529_01305 [Gemmata sp.]|nr:hypothetical protein [Gemmata sp.]